MGTATPSIETFYFAKKGRFKLFTLTERYNKKPLPEFNIIDLKEDISFSKKLPISETLVVALSDVIKKNEQAILFLNRRGFANYIICKDCGYIFKCPYCNISLTYHKTKPKLMCHYCGFTRDVPIKCEKCGSTDLSYGGAGTQKIEKSIQEIFPENLISRLDTDAVRGKGKLSKIIDEFEKGKINILTGTQMLSKGLNFPYVTLVGILFIDDLLNLPDFRAAENVFNLITQVSGRAGRNKLPGKVYIQTFMPDHYAIKFAVNYKFEQFYQYEIKLRKELNYPPFCRLIKITFEGKDETEVQQVSEKSKKILSKDELGKTQILGPIPAPISRLKGKYRYQILIKTDSIKSIKERLKGLSHIEKKVHIVIDVDPYSLL